MLICKFLPVIRYCCLFFFSELLIQVSVFYMINTGTYILIAGVCQSVNIVAEPSFFFVGLESAFEIPLALGSRLLLLIC